MGAVDEGFAQIEFAAGNQVMGERLQDFVKRLGLAPSLEPTMARRRRWVAVRKVGPRCARSQDPQNAIEYVAWIAPGTPAPVFADLRLGKKRLDCSPLLIGQIHRDFRSQPRSEVDRREIRLNLRCLRQRHLWDAL